MLALVWIAGPLTGVLVQPYVGIKSDRCQIRWGRRRPFILGGAFATMISIMILAWTREIVSGFLGIFGVDSDSRAVAVSIMFFAVILIYVLDIAINVRKLHSSLDHVPAGFNNHLVQAAIRAFIVDCAPTHQQETANAWASRISGVGNIIGMLCGGLNLPQIFPFFGNTQFKVLCAIAALFMLITSSVSCFAISERDPRIYGENITGQGLLALFRDLSRSFRRLPLQISRICQVQFFAWMGWFPFLFYTTTFIGEIYVDPILRANPNMTKEEIDLVWEQGTRRGTTALLVFAISTFLSSVILPFIIPPTYQSPLSTQKTGVATPLTSSSGLSIANYFPTQRTGWQRSQDYVLSLQSKLQIPGLTLRRAWFLAHIVYAICMALTFFVNSTTVATILVGFIGVPWALTQWAPFALIAAEISKRDAIRRGLLKAPSTLRDGSEGNLLAAGEDDAADQAGVVLGIHNVAVSAPQVIATLISSLIFRVMARPRGVPGDNSVAWCLRFGGLCAIVACVLTTRVGEDGNTVRTLRSRRPEGSNGNGRFRDDE
jgi:solute carrier family 45 protein 1/2/4